MTAGGEETDPEHLYKVGHEAAWLRHLTACRLW
jgi:hypothetical protein